MLLNGRRKTRKGFMKKISNLFFVAMLFCSATAMASKQRVFERTVDNIRKLVTKKLRRGPEESLPEIAKKYGYNWKDFPEELRADWLDGFKRPWTLLTKDKSFVFGNPVYASAGGTEHKISTKKMKVIQTEVFWQAFDVGDIRMREQIFYELFLRRNVGRSELEKRIDFLATNMPGREIGIFFINTFLATPWRFIRPKYPLMDKFFRVLLVREGVPLERVLSSNLVSFGRANFETLTIFMKEFFWKLSGNRFNVMGRSPMFGDHIVGEPGTVGYLLDKVWEKIHRLENGRLVLEDSHETYFVDQMEELVEKSLEDSLFRARKFGEGVLGEDRVYQGILKGAERNPSFAGFVYEVIEAI